MPARVRRAARHRHRHLARRRVRPRRRPTTREAWRGCACGVRPNTYTFNAMIHTYAKAGALDHARDAGGDGDGPRLRAVDVDVHLDHLGVAAPATRRRRLRCTTRWSGAASRQLGDVHHLDRPAARRATPRAFAAMKLMRRSSCRPTCTPTTRSPPSSSPRAPPRSRRPRRATASPSGSRRPSASSTTWCAALYDNHILVAHQRVRQGAAGRARVRGEGADGGAGTRANTATYTSLIDCCCRVGRLEDALHLLADARPGVQPNTATFTRLSTASARRGASTPSASSRRCSSGRAERPTFTALLSACMHSSDAERAAHALQMMPSYGLDPAALPPHLLRLPPASAPARRRAR